MKVKNGDIWLAKDTMPKLLEQKFPVKVSYQLAKLANKLSDQIKVIEMVRQGLIKKYGDKDDKGNYKVSEGGESFGKFIVEYNELMNQEVEMVFDKVRLPEKVAGTCDKCKHNMDVPFTIEPSILMALATFIEVA